MEFASIMVQNLNNNLITAPELADLRKRLKNLESKVSSWISLAWFEVGTSLTQKSRMGKLSSSPCSDHGVIMRSRLSPSACLHKPTNKLTICFKFCRSMPFVSFFKRRD